MKFGIEDGVKSQIETGGRITGDGLVGDLNLVESKEWTFYRVSGKGFRFLRGRGIGSSFRTDEFVKFFMPEMPSS